MLNNEKEILQLIVTTAKNNGQDGKRLKVVALFADDFDQIGFKNTSDPQIRASLNNLKNNGYIQDFTSLSMAGYSITLTHKGFTHQF